MYQNESQTNHSGAYPFRFSIITAVYNVEPYLAECIKSIVAQDIGFEEHVQMILIDDGSTDGSGEICDEFASRYPNNIVVIHKENGGVSSARNMGIELAKGAYVNFLDSDDMLESDTLRHIDRFFEEYGNETDIVSIPMWYFEGAEGPHALNYKFNGGSRVIKLDDDYTAVQNSLASAFVKNECIQKYRFDTRLTNLEDAQVVQKVLSGKCTLGVCAEAKYLYRRRTRGEESAVQTATLRPTWYIPCLKYFHYETINFYMERCGYLPYFIQYIIAYDLQWRIQQGKIPADVLSEEEEAEYVSLLYGLLRYLDDRVIYAQRNIWKEHKLFLLRKKYGAYPVQSIRENDVVLRYGNQVVSRLSSALFKAEMMKVEKGSVTLEGYVTLLGFPTDLDVRIFATVGEEAYPVELLSRPELTVPVFSESLYVPYAFRVTIPLQGESRVSFAMEACGIRVPVSLCKYGPYFPIPYLESAYCAMGGYIVTADARSFSFCPQTPALLKEKESAYCAALLRSGERPKQKAAMARRLNAVLCGRKKKPVWILADRIERASDNGEALALYLKEHAPHIDSYFCLSSTSPDYPRLKALGLNILEPNTKEYKIKFLLADVLLSSQAETAFLRPMRQFSEYYNDIIAQKKFVFLQHGITQNDVSKYYGRFASGISLFITAAAPEQKSILEGPYHYSADEVALTGFARYDRLYSTSEKVILFAPTWRATTVGGIDLDTGIRKAVPNVQNSAYCRVYSKLLSDPRLIAAAKEYGYRLKFVVHPNMVDVMQYMSFAPEVAFFAPDAEYRDMFACGSLMVTDYSSVAFDFAYLRKPLLYFQFDAEEFFGGTHTLKKGYFDCERDGFGEVTEDLDETVDLLIDYMKNGCVLKEKYRARVDAFFAFDDQNNCKRILDRVMELTSADRD